jgi:hypothetical protein
MPNKYSYSGVLAQYCQSGFISLPEDLYLAYIRASSVGSLTSPTQQSTTSRNSSTKDDPEHPSEPTKLHDVSSSRADDLVYSDERGRPGRPAEVSPFPFSHKPRPQDQAALVHSFINEIDNEPQPNIVHQPHLRNDVDTVQRTEPQKRHGVLVQESSRADPSPDTNWSHRRDRNAWKSTYPPVSHSSASSASLAVSASSGDYTLDVPTDFPVYADGATITPQQTRTGSQNDEIADVSVSQQNSVVNVHPLDPRSVDGFESRKINDRPDVPPRSVNRPPSRERAVVDANVRNTVAKVKLHPASTYASVPSQEIAERPRSSLRSRHPNQPKTSQDNSNPPIPESVSEAGIEVADNVAFSSEYDNGVEFPDHEAAASVRLPSRQPASPVILILPREAPPPPTIKSNKTKKGQSQKRDLNRRPVSAMSSDTQIYAPLSSTFPADSSYINEAAFIPEPNVVRPGSLPESAIERAPETTQMRSQSRGRTDELHLPPSNHIEGLYDSSASVSDSSSVGVPSIQSGQSTTGSDNRSSRYTPVYRDRKQEWLQDPSHNVAHYTALFKRDSAGHRRFASGYTSPAGEQSDAQRLNSLPNMIVEPEFAEAETSEDFDARPVSEASTSASSGFYPPDIPRYRDEAGMGHELAVAASESTPRGSGQWPRELKREDSGMGVGSVSRSPSSAQSRKNLKTDREDQKAGHGLLRKLRGMSLSGAR